jgi:hypothetical protein
MGLSGVQQFLWAGAFAVNCTLLAVLLLRKRAASFPAFTSLIAFSVARTIVLFSIALRFGVNRSRPYFRTYWTLAYVNDVILVLVFYELARHVFCPTGTWARDTRRAFRWLLAASGLLAFGLTLLASPSSTRWYQTYNLRSGFFVSVLMSELFVGMMVLAASAGLPWKTHVSRIAQGFGISSIISVGLQSANNYFGLGHGRHTYDLIANAEGFSTLVFVGFWIVTLWQQAPAPRELPDAMLMQIYTLQRRVENDLGRIRNWRRT